MQGVIHALGLQEQGLQGRTYAVTGGSSGIGLETCRELARAGARVLLATRNVPAAEASAKDIAKQGCTGQVHVLQLDLADLGSVQRCTESLKTEQLDVRCCLQHMQPSLAARAPTCSRPGVAGTHPQCGPHGVSPHAHQGRARDADWSECRLQVLGVSERPVSMPNMAVSAGQPPRALCAHTAPPQRDDAAGACPCAVRSRQLAHGAD